MLRALTGDVVLLCDGEQTLEDEEIARLRRAGVGIETRPVAGLVSDEGRLTAIRFEDADTLARDALFIRNELSVATDIPEQLGCGFDDPETITADETRATTVPGVYAAGDNSLAVSSVILAAASGARAAQTIHWSLVDEDLA
jgi:thioredoxin reductase